MFVCGFRLNDSGLWYNLSNCFCYEDFLYQKITTPLRVQCSWGSGTPVNKACRHGAVGKRTPTRPRLGVSRCVPSVCGSACTACCIRSARRSPSCSCALSRAPGQTRLPAACRSPGPGMLGPGRCGCARFCAPGRSPRPAACFGMRSSPLKPWGVLGRL